MLEYKKIFTAVDIAEILYADKVQTLPPTPEQEKVIEAELQEPVLVIAGAGSGKTETISQRVVWLIANGLVQPERVLGLTFTNKAVGELSERISTRLEKFLANAQAYPEHLQTAQKRERIEKLQAEFATAVSYPQVDTYNAFAASIVREAGASCGYSSTAQMLDKASALMLAENCVRQMCATEFQQLDKSTASVAEIAIEIENALTDNDITPQAVLAEFARLEKRLETLIGDNSYIRDAKKAMANTRILLGVALAYREAKQVQNLIEYSDQVAFAHKIVTSSPLACQIFKQRYDVVLLDEVQDTSMAQLELLSCLFKETHVMGVGDPHQSIYAWRGAAADGLVDFLKNFSAKPGQGLTYNLSQSWRNQENILRIANQLVAPLNAKTKLQVKTLQAPETAQGGVVSVQAYTTAAVEAQAIATQILAMRQAAAANQGKNPSIAIIVRKRSSMQELAKALQKNHIPYVIVGSGALLAKPEVVDVISFLQIAAKIDAPQALIRLLNGAFMQIGLADIAQLTKVASAFGKQQTEDIREELEKTAPTIDGLHKTVAITIIEALDMLRKLPFTDSLWQGFSNLGRKRLKDFADIVAQIRKHQTASIPELFSYAEKLLLLDIELNTHPDKTVHTARANLHALQQEIRKYLQLKPAANLEQVLFWLQKTAQTDDLSPAEIEPDPQAVQIITCHAAKGLEWDAVFVPQLQEGTFPSALRQAKGWLYAGKIPTTLYKDAAAKPQLSESYVEKATDFKKLVEDYELANKQQHLADERRVAYVAFTRARSQLYLSYSKWNGTKKNPDNPSVFLQEIIDSNTGVHFQPLPVDDTDPRQEAIGETVAWPVAALGKRAAAVQQAAAAVNAAIERLKNGEQLTPLSQIQEILLAKQQETPQLKVQTKVSASQLVKALNDTDNYLLQQLRPIPQKPSQAASVGTIFHTLIENYYQSAQAKQPQLEIFSSPGLVVPAEMQLSKATEEKIARLGRNFLTTSWATKQPIAVELKIEIPFANTTLPSKIDAIFAHTDPEHCTEIIEIVDWKTGKAPKTSQESANAMLQLQLYRYAYAQYANIDPEKVTATLYYAAENVSINLEQIAPQAKYTFKQLEEKYLAALKAATTVAVSVQ